MANTAPTFSTLNGTPTYTENGAAVVLDADVQILDAELAAVGYYGGASLTLARNGGANAQDVFSNSGALGTLIQGGNLVVGGITIGTVTTNSGGTLTLTFDGSATQALVNSAMQQIAYSNSSDAPPVSAQIDWIFNDGNVGAQGAGGALVATGSTTVSITAVNDAPSFVILAVGDGKVTTDFGLYSDVGQGVTLQADGKILVAGYASGSTSSIFAIARYNTDGRLDTSFDTDGKVTTNFSGAFSPQDRGYGIALQADGKILVAGSFGVARYNINGSLDTTFDTDGKTGSAGQGVIVQADGKILVAGSFDVARYNTDGSLDTSFDTDGKVAASIDGRSVTLQQDGKILVAGQSDYTSFALVRYNTDGSLDTSFGVGGTVTTNLGWGIGYSVTVQADGKILVSGETIINSSRDFALVRYNTNGSLDTTFDTDGKVTTDFGANERGYSVTVQADGKILVAGENSVNNGNAYFALARYNTDGSLDTSFDTDGMVTTNFGTNVTAYSVTLQADGKILVAGGWFGFALARYNTDGSLDTSFDGTNSLNGTPTYTENGAAVVLDSNVQIVDAELSAVGYYGGASLALARNGGANAQDVFSNSGTLSTLTQGGNLTVGGVTIGTVTTNSGGTLTLTFNSSATQTLVNSAMQQIAYSNNSDSPSTSAQIDWIFSDGNIGGQGTGGALAATGSTTVSITAVNDAPTGSVTISGIATQNQALTATNTLADADGLGTLSYQWKENGTNISGATSSTYVLTDAQVFKAITVVASYIDGYGSAESVSSAATSTVANVNDVPTGGVSISGTATQGQTLTAANTLGDIDGLGIISYQWKGDGTNISGATGGTYALTQAEVGKAISVVASYTDVRGTAEAVSSSATSVVANVNDAPTGSVTISGIATQNKILTVSNTIADIDGLGVISYQWQADGIAITGATDNTCALTQTEVGKAITVVASYVDGYGTAEWVVSSATSAIAPNAAPTGGVAITGTVTQGQTLNVANTLADADGLGVISYQWQAAGINITGATNNTYTLTEADVGKTFNVVASYTDGYGTAESVTSSATGAVANVNDVPTGSVTITGTATQNQTLTASNTIADIDGLGTISYQWQTNGINISGATGSTYNLTQTEVGKIINVVASYTDGYGTAEAVTSSATGAVANINDAPTGSVTITGSATQGQTLTATTNLADADGLGAINYKWQVDGSNIAGATNSTYTLTEAEVGKTIAVAASYTDLHGTAESVTSSATGAVANINDAPTGSVTITGSATQGQTITAANTLADADGLGTISYQWQADSIAINGASNSTYLLTQAEVGKAISVVASYTDLRGTAEAVNSSSTANVYILPTSKYFVTLSPGSNLLDFDLAYGSLSLQGQELVFTGTNGIDNVTVAPGVIFDFTKSNGGIDNIYLTGNLTDYTPAYTTSTVTLTRGTGASAEAVLLAKGTAGNYDNVVFANGIASTFDLHGWASGGALPTLSAAPALPTTLNATVKGFALDATGETFTGTSPGINFIATGGNGVDIVYVKAGATVDASKLNSGEDKIYLTGNWADYTKTATSTKITFTNGTETVIVAAATGASNDRLIFADGYVLSNDAKTALQSDTNAAIATVTGYSTIEVTPLGTGDIVTGTTADDSLNGTAAGDTLYGNGGADTINGGAGNDTIVITDLGTAASSSAKVVFTSTANGADTVIGFNAAAVASAGDVLDFSAIANLTDAVATGQTLTTDFAADNVFIFDGTPVTIAAAANAIAADVSVVATSGYIVIANSANNNAVTVYHSTDLAANGTETALVILSGVTIINLTAANFLV